MTSIELLQTLRLGIQLAADIEQFKHEVVGRITNRIGVMNVGGHVSGSLGELENVHGEADFVVHTSSNSLAMAVRSTNSARFRFGR